MWQARGLHLYFVALFSNIEGLQPPSGSSQSVSAEVDASLLILRYIYTI